MKKHKKTSTRISSIFFLGAVSALFTSCSGNDIKIGVAVVQTGLTSEIGINARNGAQIAIDRINAAGGVRGRSLKALVRDDKDDAAEAERVDAELAEAGVVAVVGHMSSRSGPLAVLGAGKRRIPLISPTISSPEFTGKDDYFFRVIAENSGQGAALAAYAYEDLGLRRIAAAFESSNRSYTETVYRSFKREFESRGGLTGEPYVFETASGFDYSAGADLLIASGADGILSVASPLDNAKLCAALERRDSRLPVLAGMWSMTEDLLEFGGRSVDRMILAGVIDSNSNSPAYTEFEAEYRRRFGAAPSFASVYAYESVVLLASALERARTTEGPDIKRQLDAMGTMVGLQDTFAMDAFGDADREYMVFGVRNGKFVRVR
jgi:branched-chain amino acid transport system substrate-binding protein